MLLLACRNNYCIRSIIAERAAPGLCGPVTTEPEKQIRAALD